MAHLKLPGSFFLPVIFLLAFSCNNTARSDKKYNAVQVPANDSSPATNSLIAIQDSNSKVSDTTVKNEDSSTQKNYTDSELSQLKGITSLFSKNDFGIINKMTSGSNMDSMLGKVQSMLKGQFGNTGDAITTSILNFQLGQMSNDNPLKSVANGMLAAQRNGTAGPPKTYTASYTAEQPVDYNIPISGKGNTIMLQYTGGSITNNKKDGLWKNMYISTKKENKINVYSESYAESSVMNIKVHATSLASTNENYSIILNDQYKKYNKQQRSDLGKNELNVQVQKIGNEKLFGNNCVHVKISYTVKALGQTAHMQDDEWYSADVRGSQFLSPLVFENHSPAVIKKIIETGCSGALVKSVSKSSGSFQLIQLSRITQKNMPDSMFTLPANYQQDKNTALYGIQ